MPTVSPDIAHVIQLAVAPVFLLAGIGAFINAFAGRLARVVDRSRSLESRLAEGDHAARAAALAELKVLRRRARLVYVGITLGIASALLVCLVIVAAFLGYFLGLRMGTVLGVLFVGAMLALVGALLAFLREVFLGIKHLAIGREL